MGDRLSDYPLTPVLNRMLKVKKEAQAIGSFLDWYRNQKRRIQVLPIEDLLARYFSIDLDRVDEEKRMVLEWHRGKVEVEHGR